MYFSTALSPAACTYCMLFVTLIIIIIIIIRIILITEMTGSTANPRPPVPTGRVACSQEGSDKRLDTSLCMPKQNRVLKGCLAGCPSAYSNWASSHIRMEWELYAEYTNGSKSGIVVFDRFQELVPADAVEGILKVHFDHSFGR